MTMRLHIVFLLVFNLNLGLFAQDEISIVEVINRTY